MDDSRESRPVLGSRELVNDGPPNVKFQELQGPMTSRGPFLALATAVLQINCGILALVFCIISLQLPTVALEEFCANAGESAVSFQRASAPAVVMRKPCVFTDDASELRKLFSGAAICAGDLCGVRGDKFANFQHKYICRKYVQTREQGFVRLYMLDSEPRGV